MQFIIYHANCWDGAAAAAVTSQGLFERHCLEHPKGTPFKTPETRGCAYNDPKGLADIVAEIKAMKPREVYLVDFTCDRASLAEIAGVASKVFIIDHHVDAMTSLLGLKGDPCWDNLFTRFNSDFSGAELCIQEFFEVKDATPLGSPSWEGSTHVFSCARRLVAHIGDRDLWRFRDPQTKAATAHLMLFPMTPQGFLEALNEYRRGPDEFYDVGEAILKYEAGVISRHVYEAVKTDMFGYRVGVVNATTLVSEIGNALLLGDPGIDVAVMYRVLNETKIFSLRSRKGGVDVSAIARKWGGNGHPSAAGFTLPLQDSQLSMRRDGTPTVEQMKASIQGSEHLGVLGAQG